MRSTYPARSAITQTPVIAWHFLPADRRLNWGDGRLVVPGETLRVDGDIEVGDYGLHGALRALDALEDAPGPIVERVRLEPPVIVEDGLVCSAARTCLWQADATRTLHEFACWCAENALTRERQAGREPDPRSWAAIEVTRRWLDLRASDEEWLAARLAARSAAEAVAWSAAEAESAESAVRAAAVRLAAWSAAWSAESRAWRAAAWAAWRAEEATQSAELERRLWLLAPADARALEPAAEVSLGG